MTAQNIKMDQFRYVYDGHLMTETIQKQLNDRDNAEWQLNDRDNTEASVVRCSVQ